jgi:methylase of polypeptide subunit release factors
VALCPYSDLILAVDPPARLASGAAPDLVMGVSATSSNLDRFSIRRHFHRALDLGTGCGILALLAAKHCREVWAVDQCPRAVEFARFNAALNGRSNLHIEEGDMFAPVSGRCFDFIVGNLPFVIAPGRRYYYRDNGGTLDTFARQAVRQAARQLEEGGFCQIMCDWVQLKGEDWRERLSAWFAECGCDAWVLRTDTSHPLQYAENWIRNSEPDTPGLAERLFAEWARYYTENGVEAIMTGMIAMRRSSGRPNWVNLEDGTDGIPSEAGALVLRAFALCDFERGASDARLLETPLRLAPDVRLMVQSEAHENAWQPAAAQLRQTAGFLWAGNIDSNAAALLARCDGAHPFQYAIASLAAELNIAPERLAPSCLPLARQLVRRGFLLPPGV